MTCERLNWGHLASSILRDVQARKPQDCTIKQVMSWAELPLGSQSGLKAHGYQREIVGGLQENSFSFQPRSFLFTHSLFTPSLEKSPFC